MKSLILPACVAAFFHALFFLVPMPPAPVISPSAATHGTTITVTMTVPHVQTPAPVKPETKPEPVKEKPKKKKKVTPKRQKPRPMTGKKEPKPKPEVVEPVKEVIQPPPDPVTEPDTEPGEPQTTEETVAQVQETDSKPEEAQEAPSAPAVGGVQSNARPTSVYAPEPRYPRAAIRRGYEGVVLLEILVNGKGNVEDVKVKESSGHGVLDRSAVKGVKKWRFSASGASLSTWVTLPVRFELQSL